MVGGGLQREVESYLQPEGMGLRHECIKVLDGAQVRMDRVMAAFRTADRPGGSRIIRTRHQGVVGTLAELTADRMDRGDIGHVETHLGDVLEHRVAVVECAGSPLPGLRIARRTLGAREELVPTGVQGPFAVDLDGVVDRRGRQPATAEAGHGSVQIGGHRDPVQLGERPARLEARVGSLDDDGLGVGACRPRAAQRVHEQIVTFGADQFEIHAGSELDVCVVMPGVPVVGPGLDAEGPVPGGIQTHPGLPDVQALRPDLNHVDVRLLTVGGRQHHGGADLVMALAIDACGNRELFAFDRLGRVGAVFDDRGYLPDR